MDSYKNTEPFENTIRPSFSKNKKEEKTFKSSSNVIPKDDAVDSAPKEQEVSINGLNEHIKRADVVKMSRASEYPSIKSHPLYRHITKENIFEQIQKYKNTTTRLEMATAFTTLY